MKPSHEPTKSVAEPAATTADEKTGAPVYTRHTSLPLVVSKA
jgi:hypothetical protein